MLVQENRKKSHKNKRSTKIFAARFCIFQVHRRIVSAAAAAASWLLHMYYYMGSVLSPSARWIPTESLRLCYRTRQYSSGPVHTDTKRARHVLVTVYVDLHTSHSVHSISLEAVLRQHAVASTGARFRRQRTHSATALPRKFHD